MAALEAETPGAEGGALPFDIGQWLNENKLGAFKDEFIKQQFDIEEVLHMNQNDLREIAKDFGMGLLHQNRFCKAVSALIQSSQKLGKDMEKDKKPMSITITKAEQQALEPITVKLAKMTELNTANDYMLKNINILSHKCENDINHSFTQFINALKNRQKELITKTKQITNTKLSTVNQQKTQINKYIKSLNEFKSLWTQTILNQSGSEPGQTIQQRKQTIIAQSTQLLQKSKSIEMECDIQNQINIALVLTEKDRENINQCISNIGYIDCNEPANPPIITLDQQSITDMTAQIMINFSNNSQLSLPQKYCLQIAEASAMDSKEEEKGERNNDFEMKMEWNEIVTNVAIDMSAINKTVFVIKNLKCETKYALQCKGWNKYGWSKFGKYVSFVTNKKVFRMDSTILNAKEKQLFCKNVLLSKLGRNKETMNVSLLFRASRDGFGADKFHSKCDGKKKTIVIIESNLGNVFGGYTKIAWTGDGKWHSDGTSFLFLCRNCCEMNESCEIYPIKQSYHSKAVKHYSSHGPCFGKGHDLLIVNAANITDSRSDGESFVGLKGNVMTGSITQVHNKYWHFVVRDYEVFQV